MDSTATPQASGSQQAQPIPSNVSSTQLAPSDVTNTALAQPVVQAVNELANQPSSQSQISSKAKESGPISTEVSNFVEIVGSDSIEKEPLPPEVASWMEKVNRDTSGEKPPEIVIAEKSGPPTVSAGSVHSVFVLPLGEEAMNGGLNQGVNNSVRWLAEWCKRLVKKLGEQSSFQ